MLYFKCNELSGDTMITSFLRQTWCLSNNGTPKGCSNSLLWLFFVPIFTHPSSINPPRFRHFQRDFFEKRRFNYPINPPKISPDKGGFFEQKYPKSPPKEGILRVKRTQKSPLSTSQTSPGSLEIDAKIDVICKKLYRFWRKTKDFFPEMFRSKNSPGRAQASGIL